DRQACRRPNRGLIPMAPDEVAKWESWAPSTSVVGIANQISMSDQFTPRQGKGDDGPQHIRHCLSCVDTLAWCNISGQTNCVKLCMVQHLFCNYDILVPNT